MHRFFISKEAESGKQIIFSSEQSAQISKVLRSGKDDLVTVFDGTGYEQTVRLDSVDRHSCIGTIIDSRQGQSEPRVKITLYQSLIKPDRFEYTLQKGVEIGITTIVPIRTTRTESFQLSPSRLTRWRKIIMESAEQSGRVILPTLTTPVCFDEALQISRGLKLIPWENEYKASLRDVLRDNEVASMDEGDEISIFIGPVGGFSPQEIKKAENKETISVSLGKRVLRSETAGIATALGVLYESGDMG